MKYTPQELGSALAIAAILSLVITALFCRSIARALDQVSPENRTINKISIWLLLIPGANLILNFFVVKGMSDSLSRELESRNYEVDEKPGYAPGLSYAILSVLMLIPSIFPLPAQLQVLALILGLAQIIFFVQYWAKMRWYRSVLKNDAQETDSDTEE